MNPLTFLLNRNKKFKKIKRTIIIVVIFFIIIMMVIGAIFILNFLDVIDLSEVGDNASNYTRF